MECKWHLCTNQVTGKGKYCSKKCKNKGSVDNFRKNLKQKAINSLGGKCQICGYDKCAAALEFHHLDPSQKDFAIGSNGHSRSWERVKQELTKCQLVCANCHREIHTGH